MTFDNLDNEALLDALAAERRKFTGSDEPKMREMVDELVLRKVYPDKPVSGNPNSVFAMVSGYGARWFQWAAPLACPNCKADLRDHHAGPPFKREIGHYDRTRDRTTGLSCPDCHQGI